MEPHLEEIVRGLQQRYDQTADFTADFTQAVEVPTLGRTLESSGQVYFKRPGRMRWEFVDPDPQTIVADGETLWVYQPDQRQVLKAPFRAAFQSSTPISFLFGVGKLEDDFNPSLVSMNAETIRLQLDPRQDKEIGTLLLTVSRGDYELRGADVTDEVRIPRRVDHVDLDHAIVKKPGVEKMDRETLLPFDPERAFRTEADVTPLIVGEVEKPARNVSPGHLLPFREVCVIDLRVAAQAILRGRIKGDANESRPDDLIAPDAYG